MNARGAFRRLEKKFLEKHKAFSFDYTTAAASRMIDRVFFCFFVFPLLRLNRWNMALTTNMPKTAFLLLSSKG